jgi:hypothetical protein
VNASASGGFQAPRFPAPVRVALAGWRGLARAGLGRVSLDAASLVTAARRTTGLHDFVDESFRDPMERLLDAIEREADLHPLGRMTLRQGFVRNLANRLRLEELERRHPEIATQPIAAPVFILGLQRTGTTMLHRLLTCESTLRPLLSWEALNPAPLPGWTRGAARDPRMRLAETAERGLRYLAPEFFAIHPVQAHAPEEDVLLLDLSFMSPTADAALRVPSYSAWVRATDQRPAYRYFRRLIRLLLWQRHGRWLGKTPHHLESLDVLLDVFPDARVIHTHRAPTEVVASFCSMMAHGRAIFSDHVDPAEVGTTLATRALRAVTHAMAVRDRVGDGAFLDVAYRDLVADPLGQMGRVYEFLGLPLGAATGAAMRAWIDGNPQHRHGTHRYRLEDFGLDGQDLAARFAPYCRRFGLDAA